MHIGCVGLRDGWKSVQGVKIQYWPIQKMAKNYKSHTNKSGHDLHFI